MVCHGVALTCSDTLETIRSHSVLALLLTECLEDITNRLKPDVAKDRCVAGFLPVLISQTDRIAERVDLILALMQFELHVSKV